jgi:thymidylate kinase
VKGNAGAGGWLIAVDGTRGADLRQSATVLRGRVGPRKLMAGVSWWDASGLFFEMSLGKRKHRTASARTLLLLYAADLAFRLRWEIRPPLEAGQTVIAAPYLDTAFAFGRACNLPRAWMTALFRFAPKPNACYRVRERKKSAGWKGRGRDGFAEFSSAVLADTSPSFEPADARRAMIAALDAARRRGQCRRLS